MYSAIVVFRFNGHGSGLNVATIYKLNKETDQEEDHLNELVQNMCNIRG